MHLRDNLTINSSGHLAIGGVDTIELAKQYKTPLYVMDEQTITNKMQMYKNAIKDFYNSNGLVCYASKAFSCKQIYRIAKQQGIGIDVVSMGELYTALSVDFDADKICYHGSNKSKQELEFAVEKGVGRIVVDSFLELEMLNKIAQTQNKKANVLLRLSPGIEASTHDFIKTGNIDSKFGFPIEFGTAMTAVKATLEKSNLNLLGIHCHIGSQIFEIEPFLVAAKIMISFLAKIKKETGVELPELNIGGSLGVKYTDNDIELDYQGHLEKIFIEIKKLAKENGLKQPFVILEPGRSIVASAGITLYEIGSIKHIEGVRTYVSVDGGMTDNIRYALYDAKYDFIVANKANKPKTQLVTIAGHCCESGDLLGKDVMIQEYTHGDILATLTTGAYNYSMASNYNRMAKPAVVFIKDEKPYIAVKRETLEDIIRNDL